MYSTILNYVFKYWSLRVVNQLFTTYNGTVNNSPWLRGGSLSDSDSALVEMISDLCR